VPRHSSFSNTFKNLWSILCIKLWWKFPDSATARFPPRSWGTPVNYISTGLLDCCLFCSLVNLCMALINCKCKAQSGGDNRTDDGGCAAEFTRQQTRVWENVIRSARHWQSQCRWDVREKGHKIAGWGWRKAIFARYAFCLCTRTRRLAVLYSLLLGVSLFLLFPARLRKLSQALLYFPEFSSAFPLLPSFAHIQRQFVGSHSFFL